MRVSTLRPAFRAALLAAVLALGPSFAAAQGDGQGVAAEEAAQLAHLQETAYGSRPLSATHAFLGPAFLDALGALRADEVFLEAGAGVASSLIAAYLEGAQRAGRAPATTLALGLEPADPVSLARMQRLSPSHRHLSGRFLEQYRPGELPRIHLLADQYGPFSYTARPHLVLAVEANLLAPGGTLFTHLTTRTRAGTDGGPYSSQILDGAGRSAVRDWLAAVRGATLVHASTHAEGTLRVERFGLRRSGEAPVVVPALGTTEFRAGSPPTRVFLLPSQASTHARAGTTRPPRAREAWRARAPRGAPGAHP